MAKQTKGTIDATACPRCGQPNDMRDVPAGLLDVGTVMQCDHCPGHFRVERKQPVVMIWLSPA